MAPGNQRGSLWGERTLQRKDWVADVEFRASGPERAGGNLNIWLAKDGKAMIGANSVYTISKFEGLVLVVDQHGNSGGMLRGFLNDGSIDYSRSSGVDSLAFGHCMFAYRNLGRPSQIKFQQSGHGLRVEVDGKLCFESDRIIIPEGYTFGLTAATPENPDSFEIFKLAVMSDSLDPRQMDHHDPSINNEYAGNSHNNEHEHHESRSENHQKQAVDDAAFRDAPKDEDADVFKTSKAQFHDLHNRMQSTTHQLSAIFRAITVAQDTINMQNTDTRDLMQGIRTDLNAKMDQIAAMERKIADLQHNFNQMRDDLIDRIRSTDNSVRGQLNDHHRTLSQTVSDNVPGHGRLIFIIIGFQVVLAVGYVTYKRRKTSPKKYL